MSREQDESRRILERMEREREKLLHGTPSADNDDDPIERLGKRIARILGPLLAVGLMAYLFITYLR